MHDNCLIFSLCPWTCSSIFPCQAVIPKQFLTFKDKASAINATGVSEELSGMIRQWLLPEMKLAVGKPEYKMIIESDLVSICSLSVYIFEQLWWSLLPWLLSENNLRPQWDCDGVNVGHTTSHAQVAAWRKSRGGKRGPPPHESRTKNVPETLWIWCQTRDGEFSCFNCHAFCYIAPCHLVLHCTIAYVLCTYNALFFMDQSLGFKFP